MFKKNEIDAGIDVQIKSVLSAMKDEPAGSDEYAKMIEQLSKLHELRHKGRVSKETLATIGANIVGLFLVIRHEHVNVITTKALSLLKKI